MTEFVAMFLETGTKVRKDERLVKALIDLIEQDDSIKRDEEFYIEENGQKIKKTALGGLDDVCLPAFLLGVWHYVVVYRKDNSVGRDTYDRWCPENGGAPRTYSGDMGKRITKTINVRMPETSMAEDDEIFDFGEEEMRRWWNEKDYIGFIPETNIFKDASLDDAIDLIMKAITA